MAKRRYHLDSQLLTLSFFVTMPLVAFSSFIVVSMARSELQEAAGRNLEQRALQTRALLEHLIGDQIIQLRLIATNPRAIETARASRTVRPLGERRRIERAWATGNEPDLLRPALTSPLVPRMRLATQLVPSLQVVQLLDAHGQLLAATSRASRPFQHDAAWYPHLSQGPDAGAFVGELQRTPARRQLYFEVVYPVLDPNDGQWLGAVRGLVSASALYGVLAPVRIGQTGRAVLVRGADGLVLVADEVEHGPEHTFPGFEAIRAAMQALRGYWIVPRLAVPGASATSATNVPARLVGYAVVEQVPHVDWIVAVEQDLDEATAPVTGITRYLWLHFVGALASVFLLALYLSLRQETPVIEDALHIHDTHVPPSMRRRHEDAAAEGTASPGERPQDGGTPTGEDAPRA